MKKKKSVIIATIIFLIAAICSSAYYYWAHFKNNTVLNVNASTESEVKKEFNPINTGVYILSSKFNKYPSIESLFTSVGFDVVSGNFNKFLKLENSNLILMLPEEEVNKLSKSQLNTLISKIEDGQCIITDGKTDLSSALNIDVKNRKSPMRKYTWSSHPDQSIKIKEDVNAYLFDYPNKYKLLASYGNNKEAICISGALKKGKFIYSSIPIAPLKGNSYDYYPFLIEAINTELDKKPAFKTNNGAIYVDIGFHGGESPSDLAAKVKGWGFDQVNIGMWSLNANTENYYKEFIEECHKRNIKAFAWFELPMVTVDFWDKHPEWREKTASGEDAHIDWRYLMAMEDPECFDAIQKYVKDEMMKFDWDGIDIAEIYFESPGRGIKSPSKFTPMHDSYVKDFKNEYGINPKEIFSLTSKNYWKNNADTKSMLIESRVNLITSLTKKMLDLCMDIKNDKPYMQTVITMIDSISDDSMRNSIGLDANEIIKLQQKYHFTLQVEDPFTLWKLGPERYKVIGGNYSKLINDEKLNIDINVVDRGLTVHPTSKQTGLELYQLVHNASKYTDQVIIYALATLEPNNMSMFPYAYYHDIDVHKEGEDEYTFDSDKKFTFEINTDLKTFYVDEKKWPIYSKDNVIIPKGKHKLSFVNEKDKPLETLRIEEINCNISSCEKNGEIINLSYNSEGRCFITVNKNPSIITLDNKNITPKISELDGRYTIFLPEGEHKITIE